MSEEINKAKEINNAAAELLRLLLGTPFIDQEKDWTWESFWVFITELKEMCDMSSFVMQRKKESLKPEPPKWFKWVYTPIPKEIIAACCGLTEGRTSQQSKVYVADDEGMDIFEQNGEVKINKTSPLKRQLEAFYILAGKDVEIIVREKP